MNISINSNRDLQQEIYQEERRQDSLVERDMHAEKQKIMLRRNEMQRSCSGKHKVSSRLDVGEQFVSGNDDFNYNSMLGHTTEVGNYLGSISTRRQFGQVSPVNIPEPQSTPRPILKKELGVSKFEDDRPQKIKQKRGTGGVKDAMMLSGDHFSNFNSESSNNYTDIGSQMRQSLDVKIKRDVNQNQNSPVYNLPSDQAIITKNKSSSNILTWGNPYSSPLNLKDQPQQPNSNETTNYTDSEDFSTVFQRKKSQKSVKFLESSSPLVEPQYQPFSEFESRKYTLDQAIHSNSRKRFEQVTKKQQQDPQQNNFYESYNENKNPNNYSVRREENPLTYNTQMYPDKPVKTAGSYIPKKKKAAIPTCQLNEEEMTHSDIKIRDATENLLEMQVKRDMLRDRLNQLDLKTNQTSKMRQNKREIEGHLDGLESEIMKVRLDLRSMGGLK